MNDGFIDNLLHQVCLPLPVILTGVGITITSVDILLAAHRTNKLNVFSEVVRLPKRWVFGILSLFRREEIE